MSFQISTLGETLTPYVSQGLKYFNLHEQFETAAKADPVGLLSKISLGVGSAYIGAQAFSTAWSSHSCAKKVALYMTSAGLFGFAAYEVVAPLFGRLALAEDFIPTFVPHATEL